MVRTILLSLPSRREDHDVRADRGNDERNLVVLLMDLK